MLHALLNPGIAAALGAALLFGASTPLAKLLLGAISPWMLAALLYLGSGLGLALYRRVARSTPARLPLRQLPWLISTIAAGGVAGPLLLLLGLAHMPASGAALLLNAESVFTALLAWFAFRENVDRRIALGMAAIVAGAVILSWPGSTAFAGALPALAVLGACFAWGLDNNLTRKLALQDASWLAMVKGWAAGSTNLVLAFSLGQHLPATGELAAALLLGFLAYGVSLTLFVTGLRHLGSARTGAYFSVAPFFGALLAVLLGDALNWQLIAAGLLMAAGVWLHLTEHHEHAHTHAALEHEHIHVHDEHHQHAHDMPVTPGTRHKHPHRHEAITHSHAHYPDAHHRHGHQ